TRALYAKERRKATGIRQRIGKPIGKRQAEVLGSAVRVPFSVPPPGSKPFDLAGFGLNSVDLLTVVSEFPTSNSKQRLQRFAKMPGGQIATAMATAARLGFRARYVGSFGDDEFGAVARDSLETAGVDISAA